MLQLTNARPVKRSDITGLYSDLCYRENVFDYVPLAELKMATKVFKINPRLYFKVTWFALFVLLPAEAVLDEKGAHRMSGV